MFNNINKFHHRIMTYCLVTITLIASYFWLRDSNWHGSIELHALIEIVTTLLAFMVGAMALVRFYSKKNNTFLIIGAGFIGTAFLDGFQAIVISTGFKEYFSSDLNALTSWSGIVSRLFLAVLLWLSYLAWKREQDLGAKGVIKEKTVFILVALATLSCCLFFIFSPLPRAYYSFFIFHHLEEFIPALFFSVALIGYLKKGAWRENSFEHWLIIALIINLVGQTVFMSLSDILFDLEFYIAHLLKMVAYLAVLMGLFISMYESFRQLNDEIYEHAVSEKALQDSEAYQTAILKSAVDGFITIDEKGNVLSFNKAAETIFKYKADEVIGQNIKMLMPEPFAHEHDGYLANYAQTGVRKIIGIGREVQGLCKDGSIFPLELTVSEVRLENRLIYSGIVRDISERKEKEEQIKQANTQLAREVYEHKLAEKALQASETYQKAIVDNAVDGLVTIDTQGIILSFNKAAEAIFKYSADEVIGQNIKMLMPESFAQHHDAYLSHYAKTGEAKIIGVGREVTGLSKGGHPFPMDLAVSKIHIDEQVIYSGIVRNITDRKQKEAELKQAKEAAEAANVAKSEFLANMSHEIRTPLNGVIGMIELALDTQLNQKQKRFLTVSHQSAELLLNVINDILDFSKIEAKKLDLDPQPFKLRDSIENTASTIGMRAHEKGIELVCSISRDIPEIVIGDNIRLQQVIINLVGNAVKFTEQGEILIKVEPYKGNLQASKEDAFLVHFSVSDTGIGIKKEKQEKIFEAFGQSDASMTRHYGGTGLGLSISSHLVQLMGGEIWLESELGKGSVFHFVVEFGYQKEEFEKVTKCIEGIKGTKVLVVDDNATNRLVLNEVLLNWEMKPFVVEDAQTALNVLQQVQGSDKAFQVIITDYQMPDLTGLELAQQVRDNESWKEIPIIMLSSVSSIAKIEDIEINTLIDGFLEKPVQQSCLFEKLQSIVGSPTEKFEKIVFEEGYKVNPKIRILLAEDNLVNQEVARNLLEKQGITQLMIVENGKKAVEAYQQHDFDVILMDVRMPEMDGFQATVTIRELEKSQQRKHIPIVALTAQAMKEDIDECFFHGMDYYTSKPIKPTELFDILATILPIQDGDESAVIQESIPELINDSDVFNLEAAMSPVGGDVDMLHRIIKVFLDTNGESLDNIRQAVNAQDDEALHNAAHSLKGAVSNFGAERTIALAFKLEKMGKSGDKQNYAQVFKQLEIENSHLVTALKAFQNEASS